MLWLFWNSFLQYFTETNEKWQLDISQSERPSFHIAIFGHDLSFFLYPSFNSPNHKLPIISAHRWNLFSVSSSPLRAVWATSHRIFVCYSRLQIAKLSSSIWALTYVFHSEAYRIYSSTKKRMTGLWNPAQEESVVVLNEGVSQATCLK